MLSINKNLNDPKSLVPYTAYINILLKIVRHNIIIQFQKLR